MQRWEYVGAGSRKFWEAGREGAAVTVRFGRLGTAGQTRTTELESEQAAVVHLAKLVAEKEKKGYREVGDSEVGGSGEMPAAEVEAVPDEDTFVVPATWRRVILPRHGGRVGAAVKPDGAAAEKVRVLVKDARKVISDLLSDPDSEPHLVEEAQAWLDGRPTPIGAAAIANAVDLTVSWQDKEPITALVDSWAAEHGLAFAAEATVHVGRTAVGWTAGKASDLQYRNDSDRPHWYWSGQAMARRTRALLAAAGDDEYQAAVTAVTGVRDLYLAKVVASYILPTERDWMDECCAAAAPPHLHSGEVEMLACSVSTPEQVAALRRGVGPDWLHGEATVLYTVADALGPAIAPDVAVQIDDDYGVIQRRKQLLGMLVEFPTDEAFTILLDRLDEKFVQPALLAAMKRYPVRALRLLGAAAAAKSKHAATVAGLLRGHVLGWPDLTAATLPELPAEVRAGVEAVSATIERLPEAGPDDVPALLREPPWTRKRKAAKPVVVPDLPAPAEWTLEWEPGERADWTEAEEGRFGRLWRKHIPWKEYLRDYRAGRLNEFDYTNETRLFLAAPAEEIRPLLAGWRPERTWEAEEWSKILAARFELDAVPVLCHLARTVPASGLPALLPYVGPEAAALAADALVRLKSVRPVARAWLRRHPEAAARLLVPAALGKPDAERRNAEVALRTLAADGHAGAVRAAAAEHGPTVAAAIETLLDTDPLDILPARMPVVGDWADPQLLPQVLLRGRKLALPPAATGHLVTVLALGSPDGPYAGVEVLKECCDPVSLAAFGRALFDAWRAAGAPSKESWALTAQGWIGDDETVRTLTPVIRAWPKDGGHSRAVAGLDVLASIGTDVALAHLYGIAQKVPFKGLKARAEEKIAEVADGLGLTPDQLADRLVPDFDLDANGSMVLDYGPRRFVVGFDEQLKPYVAEEDGRRRKDLPKPGARDDAELAEAAYRRFAGLKKDARTIAGDQIRRLERSMVSGRRWTAEEFRELFVGHPLLWHLVRRLVWVVEQDGAVVSAFRLAEDRTLAGVHDDAMTLPDGASVGVAHPLHLGDTVAVWAELFADYEILQPFPQLGRPVYALTGEERGATTLARFADRKVDTGKVLGLQRHGWQRATPQDGGVEPGISLPVPGDRTVVISLDPGIAVGVLGAFPEQRIESVWLNRGREIGWWRPSGDGEPFGELDPVTTSEVLAHLTELTA